MNPPSSAPSLKSLLTLALPLIAAYSGWTIFNAVDQWFIKTLGETAMAAMGVSAPLVWFFQAPWVGVIGVSALRVARAFERKDAESVARMNQYALAIAVSMGAVGCLMAMLSPWLLRLYGLEAVAAAQAQELCFWYFLSSLPLLLAGVSQSALEGVGRTRTTMMIMLTSFATNTLGNATLVYGLFDAPRLGARGIGLSTFASNIVSAVLGGVIWWRFTRRHGIRIVARLPDWWSGLRSFVVNALGNGFRELSNMLKWAAVGWVLSWCGTTVMAANGVAMLWSSILFIPIHAIGRATGILVGRSADRPQDRSQYLDLGIRTNLIYSTILIVVCFNVGAVFTGIHVPADWGPDHPGRSLAVLLLTLISFHSLADSPGACLRQALDAVEDTWSSPRYHVLLLVPTLLLLYLLYHLSRVWPGERVATLVVFLLFVFFLSWSLLCLRRWRRLHRADAVKEKENSVLE